MTRKQTYNPSVGDQVRILGRSEIFRVVSTGDPALVELESKAGKRFKAGWRALDLIAREDAE